MDIDCQSGIMNKLMFIVAYANSIGVVDNNLILHVDHKLALRETWWQLNFTHTSTSRSCTSH